MKTNLFSMLIPVVMAVNGLPALVQGPSVLQQPTVISQSSNLTTIAEDFVTQLGQQQFANAAEGYAIGAQDVTDRTLRQNWNDIVAENGAFQQIISSQVVSQQPLGGEAIVAVVCQFERSNRELFVVLSGSEVVSFSPVE